MTDYINTEIVEYVDVGGSSDSNITLKVGNVDYVFDRSTFWDNFGVVRTEAFIYDLNGQQLGFRFLSLDSSFELLNSDSFLDYLNDNYSYLLPLSSHFVYSKSIKVLYVEYCGISGGNGFVTMQRRFDVDESEEYFGVSGPYVTVATYSLTGNFQTQYSIPVPSDFLPVNYFPPFLGSSYVDGSDIFFLYNFGQRILNSFVSLNSILGFSIGGSNFLTFILSTGFVVYMSYTVIKWFIPL